MPYTIKYTDPLKTAIEVADNTVNSSDTSLQFSGRNTTNYGSVIAENLLHLLENFAGPQSPVNPSEGQLWYNNSDNTLYVNDGSGDNGWQPASGVRSGDTTPTSGKLGDIWVDTTNQQIFIYTGQAWILVGPLYSSGAKSGPIVETLTDVDNVKHFVVTTYAEGVPVAIAATATFIPKPSITGFPSGVGVGVTLSTTIEGAGGAIITPKFWGTATSADGLMVPGTTAVVSSANFLRSDTKSTTNYQLNVLSNDGLKIGSDGNFTLSVVGKDAIIYNASADGSVDIRNNNVNGRAVSILKVVNQRVGINNTAPEETLDVSGNQKLSGKLNVTDASIASNLTTAAVTFAGGLAVTKNIIVGTTLGVTGTTTAANIVPDTATTTIQRLLGTSDNRWNHVYANSVTATTFNGTFQGNFTGNATTANTLSQPTTFTLDGDITSDAVVFNGGSGGYTKTFNTSIRAALISEKTSISSTNKSDEFLLYRPTGGLYKTTRDNMVGDLAVPIGAIMPFAGITPPVGYLLCDGSEVEKDRYPELWVAIQGPGGDPLYGTPTLGTNFKLPDLRGRFALGKDNMDNGTIVAALGGGTVDSGGGTTGRVNTDAARTLGASGGQEQQNISVDNLPKAPVTTGTAVTVPYGSGTSTGQLGNSLSVMNPFITLNYIIRSGKQGY